MRRLRPWQLAVGGVAVVAVGASGLLFAGGDGGQSAPTTNPVAAAPVESVEAASPATTTAVQATAAPTASTLVTSTILSAEDAANGLAGQYQFSMTVTDGNPSFPVGTSQNVTVTFSADCPGASCSVSSPEYAGATWSFDGTNLATSVNASEPCPNGSGQVPTVIDVTLRIAGRDDAGRATSLSGTQNHSAPGASSCENAANDPVTWTIVAARAD